MIIHNSFKFFIGPLLALLTLKTPLKGNDYYYNTHLTDEQTEAQRGKVTGPGHTASTFLCSFG